ncbi:uncharacterized protein LOC134087985 isoform X2 [Sardina pilchardus]|uniref:uncharacterized protein LOC134087985 isoform X2 n=1 Tax=Sardina pilchardus TaxID=27697 RepID=UPI002E1486C0
MEVMKQRGTLRSPAGGVPHIYDMKIVLLGNRNAGKSSSGNSILGREEFSTSGRTAECVKREGETAGRRITVVEAPGWWKNYTVEETPERDKQEIVLSVSLCPPGPHALLLLIRVSQSFTETHRRAVQEHMELLGERVWSHTIVLFTYGDCLGDKTIEHHIESGGEALQWVVEKCGNRYHVVDNEKSDGGQVTELLEKIEEMVAGNRGYLFDFDRNISEKLQEKKKEAERRAEERKMKVHKQRQTLRSSAGGVPHISDMKIVLLGGRNAGKSSSGNSILGREEFSTSGRTAECVKREGETAGRRITVVEAPGWWMNCTVEETPERDKQEIVLSVSLCPPGPHALLLIIRVDYSFTETNRRAVQEHMELLGEIVWSHTIVLFTCGDCLGDTTIEQHIESEGEALQWVVEKCGNRYHVVDNEKRDVGQVTELLEKIEEMVAGNRGHQFDFDRNVSKQLQEKKKESERRAEERKMKVHKQRQTLRSAAGGVPHISDMKIVLLGGRLLGKSSSGNSILGREEFSTSGRTAECVKREGETAGRHITVVEAPGWWSNYTVEQTPERDKQEIVLSVSLCPPGPHALLLIIRVIDSFTETDRRAVQEHMELLGERVWSHTIVLFTWGDCLGDTTIEQHIESEGEALQWVVEKCGNRYHVVDNKKRDGGQVTELLEKTEEMVAGNGGYLFDFDRNISKKLPEKKMEAARRAEERKMKVHKQRQNLRSSAGGVPHIYDLKIVLLGGRLMGKSSSGNSILGREEFSTSGRTAECVKRDGETAGRRITVVEAPGWWNHFTVEETPERDKQEIVLSVSLCPPGPHALLLLIRVDESFTETHRRAVQEHMELLGERVWSHTIVLFTYGDWLGDTTIEQHIESGGEALQWVVEKCGNRYHFVDNKKSDGGQVTELLEKIEEMVAGNRGHQFDFDRNICDKLPEKKKEAERRAEERKMKVHKQRQTLRSSAGAVPHVSDMKIVLLGKRNAGKSSSGNSILGREEFSTSGRTAECVKREGETAGRRITVVEAPGWWRNCTLEQTPERDKQEIVLSVSLCPPGPHALLLLIRVSQSFTETDRRAVQEHMELLGERVWSHTIVLFTYGDCLGDTTIEQHIESEGEALQWVVEKCRNRYHFVDNKKRDGGQVTELLEKIEEMVAGNRGHQFDFDRNISKQLQEKKKEAERRAEERKMKVHKQRQTLRSSAGGVPHIYDMKIVLLGNRNAGKSSSGNSILGREEFSTSGRTAECVKREGETAGRRITVVEAPGWWKNCTVEQTPERDKQEIVLSVSLCPPGPHALLLIIDVSKSFTETHRRAVQEHMELLGERVWSHTIVLFTYGDCLGDTTIEQHIESGGEALQWVVEKCGNRYHVVDNEKRDGGQVTELLEKIEEMVAGNRGYLFDFDRYISEKLQEKKKEAERRAEERKMKVHKQRQILRSSAGGVPHISDMKIVLLGGRVQGKSSSGNSILGREEFSTSGRTAECVKREGETAGRRITVVEAPGWWMNYTVEKTPERDKQEIVLSVSLCPPGPHALLLLIRVIDSFTETHRRAVQEHMELLGERVWSHTIVLFTCGDCLGDTTIEQHIESGGEALQWVVEKCGNRYHVVDNTKRDGGQVTELLEKIEEMVAGNRGYLFDFDRNISKQLQEKKKEAERRVEERKMKVHKQRQTLRSSAGGVPHIYDMKIVLLGNRNEGKSSSGNTILGREEFSTSGRTAECVKREGETAGRRITVVEAPGWWSNYTVEKTPERDKQEIVLSVSLCPPGPHALLLIIDVSESFTETDRRAVQEHMELLGERVWSHTIVLFTCGDCLGDTTIEQHIESGGEALQWVVEKCGNRYHVVDNEKRDGGQVTELLERIEEMVAGNRGHQFDFDRNISEELQEKKKEAERRAEERKMKVHKQRQTLRSSAGGVPHISDMKIVLLGGRKDGKSSSGNTILGREEFSTSGRTAECVKREGETAGRRITVVEAPGWWKNFTVEQTPERDKQEIVLSVSLCPPGPHALLLIINVSRSFTETHRRAVQEHMELLGERVWSHTVVLFTRGDCLGDTAIEQHIESGGEALQWVVEKCGNRYHVVDNEKRDGGQVTELLEKIEEMVAGNRGYPFQLNKSMEIPPRLREHTPGGSSGFGSALSELTRPFKHLKTAASTQSSGYGTGGAAEEAAAGEMGAEIHRPVHGDENVFVDVSTISIYNNCIGRGSFGAVYRGSYQGAPAAVKIIPIGGSSVITNEFLIPLRLSHPRIVRMMAVARSETQILIANEYIHGADLNKVIYKDTPIKLQYKDKLSVALDVAMAVEYIHGERIIHQDLKPANIMISQGTRQAYLTDWGLANFKETMSGSGQTGKGKTAVYYGPLGGTPPYMAPECIVECKKCSPMSDMWSLGITLLEMFTNSAPWPSNNQQEIRELLYEQQSPQALGTLQPALHDMLKPLIEFKPNSRMNAKDLVELLKPKVDVNKRQ